MVGNRFGLRRSLPDSTFLIFILLLNLAPWIPFFRSAVGTSQIRYPSFGQDEMHYVARAHAIWQGKDAASAFLSTTSGVKDGLGNFAEHILFFPSKLVGVDSLTFPDYFYLVLSISSLVSLASCYYFFKFMTKSGIIAASATLIFVFFAQFIDLSGIHFPAVPIFNRWPTPILHYFLIFLFLRILLDPDLRYRKLVGILTFAFGFYLYLYTWQTLGALIAGAILISLVSHNSTELKQLFIISLGGVLLAMPAILGLMRLALSSKSDGLLQFTFRQQETHLPLSDKMSFLLCLFAIVAWIQRKRIDHIFLQFVSLCAFAGIIVSNQQVITGKLVQPGHFHWYFIAPAFFSCLALIIFQYIKSKSVNLLILVALTGIFGLNQIQVIPIAQEEARTQISSGLSTNELKALRGNVFALDSVVLDQLATSYKDGLYWHTFGIYYSGSRDLATESVAFSSIWLGASSPINFASLQIRCLDFRLDPCSTARMLLGSESNVDWFEYVSKGNPVQQSLSSSDSKLAKALRAASTNPDVYFKKVIGDRNIRTFVLKEAASKDQLALLGSGWKLSPTSGKFWIYTRITS